MIILRTRILEAFQKRARAISMHRAAYALCHRAATIFHSVS